MNRLLSLSVTQIRNTCRHLHLFMNQACQDLNAIKRTKIQVNEGCIRIYCIELKYTLRVLYCLMIVSLIYSLFTNGKFIMTTLLPVEERLRSSRNVQAKAVLTAMKDYVLEFENESPYSESM